MRKSAVLISLLMILFCVSGVEAIDVKTSVVSIETHPDFWAGLFPTSVSYRMQLGGVEFIPGRETGMGLELSTGTLARAISTDPITGQFFANSETPGIDELKVQNSYDTLYSAWKLGILQGFGHSKQSGKDLFQVRLSFDGHWEVALNPLLQTQSRTGHPFDSGIYTENTEFAGTPDLSGDRQLMSTGFSIYAKMNDLLLKTALTSGVEAEFEFNWFPKAMNFSKESGGIADYVRLWAYCSGGKMLLQNLDSDSNNLKSLGFSYDFEFRYLSGEHIPKYAEELKGYVWWYEPVNSTVLLRSTAKIDYYGKQFLKACVPYAYVFFDYSYATGRLNNTKERTDVSIHTSSLGFHVELKMFDVLHVYYEIGKVLACTGDNSEDILGFRSSDAFKVTVSLKL